MNVSSHGLGLVFGFHQDSIANKQNLVPTVPNTAKLVTKPYQIDFLSTVVGHLNLSAKPILGMDPGKISLFLHEY